MLPPAIHKAVTRRSPVSTLADPRRCARLTSRRCSASSASSSCIRRRSSSDIGMTGSSKTHRRFTSLYAGLTTPAPARKLPRSTSARSSGDTWSTWTQPGKCTACGEARARGMARSVSGERARSICERMRLSCHGFAAPDREDLQPAACKATRLPAARSRSHMTAFRGTLRNRRSDPGEADPDRSASASARVRSGADRPDVTSARRLGHRSRAGWTACSVSWSMPPRAACRPAPIAAARHCLPSRTRRPGPTRASAASIRSSLAALKRMIRW